VFGKDERIIDMNIKDPPSARDHLGFDVKVLEQFGSQTGRLRQVVSLGAIFDLDFHFHDFPWDQCDDFIIVAVRRILDNLASGVFRQPNTKSKRRFRKGRVMNQTIVQLEPKQVWTNFERSKCHGLQKKNNK
jgi:hypothetical protein